MHFTQRQVEILSTALQIVASEGTRALTMKSVARKLDLTEPAIYRHFENKQHLLLSLYEFVKHFLISELEPTISESGTVSERLKNFVKTLLDYLSKHQGVNLILLAETIYHQDKQLKEAMLAIFLGIRNLVVTLLEEGIKNGELAKSLKPQEYANCLLGMVQGVLTFYILNPGSTLTVEEETENIINCFLTQLTTKTPS